MKTLVFLSAALALTVTFAAHAAPRAERPACAFGESTADLTDHLALASGARGKIWYQTESLTLSRPERLHGLSSAERKMIVLSYDEEGNASERQQLKDFAGSDGYITYFQHNSNGREFAIVASFPGDNEYGAIFEIMPLRGRSEHKILRVVARIADGDLEDCRVTKDEVRE